MGCLVRSPSEPRAHISSAWQLPLVTKPECLPGCLLAGPVGTPSAASATRLPPLPAPGKCPKRGPRGLSAASSACCCGLPVSLRCSELPKLEAPPAEAQCPQHTPFKRKRQKDLLSPSWLWMESPRGTFAGQVTCTCELRQHQEGSITTVLLTTGDHQLWITKNWETELLGNCRQLGPGWARWMLWLCPHQRCWGQSVQSCHPRT